MTFEIVTCLVVSLLLGLACCLWPHWSQGLVLGVWQVFLDLSLALSLALLVHPGLEGSLLSLLLLYHLSGPSQKEA